MHLKRILLILIIFIALLLLSSTILNANKIITLSGRNLLEMDIEKLLDYKIFSLDVAGGKVLSNRVYKKVNGRELTLDIYTPLDNKLHPVIIFIHGGFFIRGTKDEIRYIKPLLEELLKKGYLVISTNYRLYDRKSFFPDNIQDIKDTIRWVRQNSERLSANPDKIGLIGHSAGGNLALLAGLTDNQLFQGSKKFAGYSSKADFVISCSGPTKLYDIEDFGFDLEKTLISYFSGNDPDHKLLKKASPLTYLKKDAPPLLLIHGTGDVIVPYSQAKNFYLKARELGIDCNLVKIIDGGHTLLLTYLAQIDRLKSEIIKFIEKNW